MLKKRCSYVALVCSLSCTAITGATSQTNPPDGSPPCIFVSAPPSEETINRMSDKIEDTNNEVDALNAKVDLLEMRLKKLILTMEEEFVALDKAKSTVVQELNSINNASRRNSINLYSLNEKFAAHTSDNTSTSTVSQGELETIQAEIQQTVQEQKAIKTTVEQKENQIRQLEEKLKTCHEKVGSADNKASLSTIIIGAGILAYTGVKAGKIMTPKKIGDARSFTDEREIYT